MDPATALHVRLRRRVFTYDARDRAVWRHSITPVDLPAAQTALLLCDVWDRHWSRGATERVEAMVPRMNQVVRHLRARGVLIIHAPSDTMDFYAGTPARQRALEAPPAEPPPPRDLPDPPLPVDASDGGSDTGETPWFKAWVSQHPGIEVDHTRDVITDNGLEVYRLLQAHGIQHLLIMGVHTNMCVLGRSFGIKQMVRWGVDVALIRDLTDTMYNPARPPYVSHEEGTRLVVDFIEAFWAPSLHSDDLLPG